MEKDINHKYNLNMENALDKALANASLNARMNGDTLHTENLSSIGDPTLDQFDPNRDGVLTSKTAFPNPRTEFELLQNYQQKMEAEYAEKVPTSNAASSSIHHLSVLTQIISDKTSWIQQQLTEVYAQLSRIETTIITAAQSMPETPNHKHRSLHEWDDTQLLNELVERENDLMPFYFELLKRIGSPELHNLVMSSMQGKNASMMTLAQLCSVIGTSAQGTPPQASVQYPSEQSQISQQQIERLQSMSQSERNDFVQRMNSVVPQAIPNWENSFPQR